MSVLWLPSLIVSALQWVFSGFFLPKKKCQLKTRIWMCLGSHFWLPSHLFFSTKRKHLNMHRPSNQNKFPKNQPSPFSILPHSFPIAKKGNLNLKLSLCEKNRENTNTFLNGSFSSMIDIFDGQKKVEENVLQTNKPSLQQNKKKNGRSFSHIFFLCRFYKMLLIWLDSSKM